MKLKCPHCAERIGLFTKEWQSQRNSEEKTCPACTKKVKVTFSGKRFAIMLPICAVYVFPLAGYWRRRTRGIGRYYNLGWHYADGAGRWYLV